MAKISALREYRFVHPSDVTNDDEVFVEGESSDEMHRIWRDAVNFWPQELERARKALSNLPDEQMERRSELERYISRLSDCVMTADRTVFVKRTVFDHDRSETA